MAVCSSGDGLPTKAGTNRKIAQLRCCRLPMSFTLYILFIIPDNRLSRTIARTVWRLQKVKFSCLLWFPWSHLCCESMCYFDESFCMYFLSLFSAFELHTIIRKKLNAQIRKNFIIYFFLKSNNKKNTFKTLK